MVNGGVGMQKQKTAICLHIRGFQVSEMRFELTQPFGHYPLKVACLPIPPPGQNDAEGNQSEKRDSNPRPRPWQGRALPTELFSQAGRRFFRRVRDEIRTHTAFRPLPPQSSVSTNSTTRTSKRSDEALSEKRDSNPRPRPWQGRALPTELFSHFFCWCNPFQTLFSRIAMQSYNLFLNCANF